MPLYKAGHYGPTACIPGDTLVMFDGTETPGADVKSIALSRATGPTLVPAGIVFTVDFGSAPTAVVLIEAANEDTEAKYQVLDTITDTQHAYYDDQGNFAFYRAVLSTYSAGGMPQVVAQR